jgi:hypothetical protein
MSKDSPDTTVGLDKKFSEKVEKQNQKALKGNQKKLDMNRNGRIDAEDFKLLKKKKKRK